LIHLEFNIEKKITEDFGPSPMKAK
jgi:hypothetical protein